MSDIHTPHRIQTVVIGGGQAGLSVGYHLSRRGLEFVILESHGRVGDSWRQRWDSLRLFTPARFDGLVGMRFPAPSDTFPTKDEMADYLEAYAAHFNLPVQTGVTVDRQDTVFAELSEDPGDDTRVIAVGRLVLEPTEDSALVPGGRWVHHQHKGPVADIGDSFGAMFDFADAQGETVGALTLDVGYERDGEEHVHQLYVQLV